MEATRTPPDADPRPLMTRLERGEIATLAGAPFPLPQGDELSLLCELRTASLSKNISYDPATKHVSGFIAQGGAQPEPLGRILAAFSRDVTDWLACALPAYGAGWALDRATFRSEEEATRRLRLTARNDLLHVDAFPNRPSLGRRILRVFVNVNPSEPRVWVTSEPFAKLLERYGAAAGLPGVRRGGWLGQLGAGVRGILRAGRTRSSAYDRFMLRFHDFLKQNDEFQERAPKRLWSFAPGEVWLAMTDACSHAVLRGRFALEHSYFVPAHVLALPDESPAALLERACAAHQPRRAA